MSSPALVHSFLDEFLRSFCLRNGIVLPLYGPLTYIPNSNIWGCFICQMQKIFYYGNIFMQKKMIAVITRRKIFFSISFERCFIIFTLVGSDSCDKIKTKIKNVFI